MKGLITYNLLADPNLFSLFTLVVCTVLIYSFLSFTKALRTEGKNEKLLSGLVLILSAMLFRYSIWTMVDLFITKKLSILANTC